MTSDAEIREAIRSFIVTNFLPGESPDSLKDSTRLLSSGIITSMSMLELVAFLEETFSITIEPTDVFVDQMDSVDALVQLVRRHRSKASTGSPG